MKLADAYGVAGERVSDAAGLEAALKRAVAGAAPSLIEVPVGELPTPLLTLAVAAGGMAIPALLRM